MTHHVHPYIFRLNHAKTWKSRWLDRKHFIARLREDILLREWLDKKLRHAHIDSIEFERAPNILQVIIKTARPGILIGRGGEGAEKLKVEIGKYLVRIRKRFASPFIRQELKLTIEEVRAPESQAAIVAQTLVEGLEKRVPFRRVMKETLAKTAASKDVKGVKIALRGRLDGSEMARYEWAKKGRIPLQTLRAAIDYAEKTAYLSYGTTGVKVWIYKGDVFEEKRKM